MEEKQRFAIRQGTQLNNNDLAPFQHLGRPEARPLSSKRSTAPASCGARQPAPRRRSVSVCSASAQALSFARPREGHPATHSASQTRVNALLLSRGPRCGDPRHSASKTRVNALLVLDSRFRGNERSFMPAGRHYSRRSRARFGNGTALGLAPNLARERARRFAGRRA